MAHTRGSRHGHSPPWYRGEAERWRDHPDYPVEAAR